MRILTSLILLHFITCYECNMMSRHFAVYFVANSPLFCCLGICVVDPEDPFPALPPQSWLLSLCAQKQSIDMLLGRLPDLVKADPAFNIATSAIPSPPTSSAGLRPVQHTRPGATAAVSDSSRHILSYSSPTAALKGVQIALKEIGGRIVLLTDSNPDIG